MSQTREVNWDPDLWKKQKSVKKGEDWTVEGRPVPQVQVKQFVQPPNIPGKTYLSVLVTFPPDSANAPHHHNGAAVFAQVVKGRIVSQMIHTNAVTQPDGTTKNEVMDSGPKAYASGEVWYEAPGCHHVRAENPFTEEASLFATFVIDSQKFAEVENPAHALVIYDAAVEEAK